MLLTNPNGPSDNMAQSNKSPDKSKIDLLLVYLVGETPKIGVNKRALRAALDEISWFCVWGDDKSVDDIRQLASESRACSTKAVNVDAGATGPEDEPTDSDADFTAAA